MNEELTFAGAAQIMGRVRDHLAEVVVGQPALLHGLQVALLAGGHCLLEGVPGVAKTLAVRTFATVVGGSFARVQFTPDLVPSDIVGTRIYLQGQERFDVELGPVFVNVLLADEVNRSPAKVQAAMLEVMAEHQVTLGGQTHHVPEPFLVVATQNPVESEGVFQLPEAQRDRFLLKLVVPLPSFEEEKAILTRMSQPVPAARPVLNPEQTLALQRISAQVYVHPLVAEYVVRLIMATRQPSAFGVPDIAPWLAAGLSPRATLGLLAAARATALLAGRDHVLPGDVQAMAMPVMAHRLLLTLDAYSVGATPEHVVSHVLSSVAPPEPVRLSGH